MSSHEPLILRTGTPVILVEIVVDCHEGESNLFLAELPRVHAGRLTEPHPLVEGINPSLLMEGPYARNLASDAFGTRLVFWSPEGETMLIFTSEGDDESLRICWVMEDIKGLLDELEPMNTSSWETMEEVRTKLYKRTIETFAFFIVNSYSIPFGMY